MAPCARKLCSSAACSTDQGAAESQASGNTISRQCPDCRPVTEYLPLGRDLANVRDTESVRCPLTCDSNLDKQKRTETSIGCCILLIFPCFTTTAEHVRTIGVRFVNRRPLSGSGSRTMVGRPMGSGQKITPTATRGSSHLLLSLIQPAVSALLCPMATRDTPLAETQQPPAAPRRCLAPAGQAHQPSERHRHRS
jgi:hypothetical protein